MAARLVTVSEGNASGAMDEPLLKRLTGGDPVTCRPPYRASFSYLPAFKLLFVTNEFPRFASQGHALRRRLRLLPFRQTFYSQEEGREPRRDEALREKLREELPGLLAWAVRGCREWLHGGLNAPAAVMQETAWRLESYDPLAEFLRAECYRDPSSEVSTARLWQAYLHWCACHQHDPSFRCPTTFNQNLAQRDGLDIVRRHRGRYLIGLGLSRLAESSLEDDLPLPDLANVH